MSLAGAFVSTLGQARNLLFRGRWRKGLVPSRKVENKHVGAKLWNIYTRQESSSCIGLLLPREIWQPIKVVVRLWGLESTKRADEQICRSYNLCSRIVGERLQIHNSHGFLADSSGSYCFFSAFLG